MDDSLAYQDPPRFEIVDGKPVMMSHESICHNNVKGNIYHIFRNYLKGKNCKVYSDGTDLYLSNRVRYIPDVMVLCDQTKRKKNGIHGAPDLVVEVLSPSTGRNDRIRKFRDYEQSGVREYWMVSPQSLSVEQYVLEEGQFRLLDVYHYYTPEMVEEADAEERARVVTEFPCTLFEDLVIPLSEVFYDVAEE